MFFDVARDLCDGVVASYEQRDIYAHRDTFCLFFRTLSCVWSSTICMSFDILFMFLFPGLGFLWKTCILDSFRSTQCGNICLCSFRCMTVLPALDLLFLTFIFDFWPFHWLVIFFFFPICLFIVKLFCWNSRFIHLVQHFVQRIPILQGI